MSSIYFLESIFATFKVHLLETQSIQALYNKYFWMLLAAISIPYMLGLFLPVMELDSAQDATMAMQMARENAFLYLIKSHAPYLDKPHMHFWLSAFSMKLFGVNEFAYRLPAFLLIFLAAFSTYKLGKLLYNAEIAKIACLIFLSAQTIVLSAHDVRTDAVLTGFMALSLWKLVDFLQSQKSSSIFWGGIFLGFAFDSKGWLGVMMVGFCLIAYLAYSRNWKAVWNAKLLWGILAFFIGIFPVLYAYYIQYDLQPEQVINGRTHVSGVKFILWDQVFNRLNAEGFEESSPDYTFFFHTLLWAFLPFSILFYIGVFKRLAFFIQTRFKPIQGVEFLTLGGFLLIISVISFSKFKLPHYLNGMIPILSLFTASFLWYQAKLKISKNLKIYLIIQQIIIAAFILITLYICFYAFSSKSILILIFSILGLCILLYFFYKKRAYLQKILILSLFASAWVNFNLNGIFYPNLLDYQGGRNLAKYVKDQNLKLSNIYYLNNYNWTFDFYTQHNTSSKALNTLKTGDMLVAYPEDLHFLKEKNWQWVVLKEVENFHVTQISLNFLNPKTRPATLSPLYLIQMK